MLTPEFSHPERTCTCGDPRDIVTATLHGEEVPPCDLHRPPSSGTSGFALNNDAAIFSALGMTTTDSKEL